MNFFSTKREQTVFLTRISTGQVDYRDFMIFSISFKTMKYLYTLEKCITWVLLIADIPFIFFLKPQTSYYHARLEQAKSFKTSVK